MLILTHPLATAAAPATAGKNAAITKTSAKPLTTTLNNALIQRHPQTKPISRFRIARFSAAATFSLRSRLQKSSLHMSSLLLIITALWCCCEMPTHCVAIGYSYSRFVGPVSGPEHKVLVYDAASGGSRVDFMAKPEYAFAYGVEDGTTRVLQNRQETREGDAVKGVYSVVDPDGKLRVVKYTADDVNGFQAEIITNEDPTTTTTNHGHDDSNQNYDGAAAVHNANGKDTTAINWQKVHGFQPPRQHGLQQSPRLHEVQHVVGGAGGGKTHNADEGNQAAVKHAESTKSNYDNNNDDDDGDYEDANDAVKSTQNQVGSEESGDDDDADETDDDYEDAQEEAQSYEEESNEY